MPKRKREEVTASSAKPNKKPTTHTPNKRKKLCAERIAAAQKPLLSALRHAAALERQKFSRRKKNAKSTTNDKASQRLEVEYTKLKQLDLTKLAEQHLRRTIGKVKSLRENDDIPEKEKVAEKVEQDVALLNVQGRLFKVDAVRKVMDEVIDDLKEIVGAGATTGKGQGEAPEAKNKKKTKSAEVEEEEVPMDIEAFDSDVLAAFDARIAAPSSADEDSEDSLSEGHRPPSVGESESEDDDEFDLDEDVESGEDASPILANGDSIAEESSDSGALHDSDIESESEPEVDEVSTSLPKLKPKATLVEKPSKSTFLPSLSHAAYVSGSESEASDLDADLAPRKNRRGQKARQKIWEKKYGDKAKHKEKEDRAKGWDAKRGAVSGDRRGGQGRGNGPPRGYGPEKSGENAIPLGKKKVTKRDDVGNLHPSWQAAKAAKEKKTGLKIDLSANSSKKVVFD
ncbi:Bud-site selection protein [Periconia macrospinosa]|uniref:Bud-site selection protein n=1 Tax=Periconia macrospinosa TaxID=97972 RepID=A0A2V1E637_9PLEO|nr:Bud-site selection protein [Periconia macrospinosa]